MAIRFYCQSCRQPIEVDETDAGRDVLCYYCRERNVVPPQSDAALSGEGSALPPGLDQALPAPPGKSATLGIIGFVATLAMIGSLIFILAWGYSRAVLPTLRTPNFASLPAETQQKILGEKMEQIRKHPVIIAVSWLFLLLIVLGLGFSIAGIVTRRGTNYAVAGLVIGLIVVLFILYSTYLTHRRNAAKPQASGREAVVTPVS